MFNLTRNYIKGWNHALKYLKKQHFTISDKWWSPSSSDFHVRLETPWSKGNRLSSSTVISALVALALHNCPVLLPSLSALPHSGCPSIQCTHRPTSQKPSLTAQYERTQSTPGGQRGESHCLCVCLFFFFFAFVRHCARQRLCERVCTNHLVQNISYSQAIPSAYEWQIPSLKPLLKKLHKVSIQFLKKVYIFILKRQLRH